MSGTVLGNAATSGCAGDTANRRPADPELSLRRASACDFGGHGVGGSRDRPGRGGQEQEKKYRGRRPRIVEVPVLGTIAAGQPIPVPTSERWAADVEDTVAVTEDMVRGKANVFALRVKGTSMIEDLIDDGDIVFLEPARSANDGDRVAVWLKDREEVTFKRYFHEGSRVRLQPANAQMDPIILHARDVKIQGRVIGVLRKY